MALLMRKAQALISEDSSNNWFKLETSAEKMPNKCLLTENLTMSNIFLKT